MLQTAISATSGVTLLAMACSRPTCISDITRIRGLSMILRRNEIGHPCQGPLRHLRQGKT